jgi:hypothetical protein
VFLFFSTSDTPRARSALQQDRQAECIFKKSTTKMTMYKELMTRQVASSSGQDCTAHTVRWEKFEKFKKFKKVLRSQLCSKLPA